MAHQYRALAMDESHGERRSSSSSRYNPNDKEGLLWTQNPKLKPRRTWLRALTMPTIHVSLILGYTLLFFILLRDNKKGLSYEEQHLVYCKKERHQGNKRRLTTDIPNKPLSTPP